MTISQLSEETRPNGTRIVTVEVSDEYERHLVFEVNCVSCESRHIESNGGLDFWAGSLGQVEHYAEALALADLHVCAESGSDQ